MCITRRNTEHFDVLAPYHAVALTRRLMQPINLQYRDVAPSIFYQTTLLQTTGDARNAGAGHTEHLSQKLLGERQFGTHQFVHPKKPTAHSLGNLVIGVTSSC